MHRLIAVSLCGSLLLAGCGRDYQIESYEVPKLDRPEQQRQVRRVPGRLLSAIVPRGEEAWFFTLRGPDEPVQAQLETFSQFVKSLAFQDGKPQWELPEGWSQADDSGGSPMNMRFATITVPTDGKPLELTVMSLPINIDDYNQYLLANVNRWRRELALAPTTVEKLFANESRNEEVRRIEVGGLEVTLVNLAGMMEEGGGSRPPFAPFASGGTDDVPRFPPNAGQGESPSPALTYDAPPQWSPGRKSRMRYAAFQVSENGKKVEITIIPLQVSGLLANVNRWRRLVGLERIARDDLDQEVKPIQVDGMTGDYVELNGPEATILAVRLVRGDRAWFFKLQGDPELAQREKERFEQFVKSVEFQ